MNGKQVRRYLNNYQRTAAFEALRFCKKFYPWRVLATPSAQPSNLGFLHALMQVPAPKS